ncbi:MAG: hypothetical protein LAQ30_23875 [Acidobacteriia bacterium]|nr:hypothetical protein [Terriglobia bacterium]
MMRSAAGLTVKLRAWVAVAPALSFTCAVKLEEPKDVGVPLRTPPELKDNPDASEPAVTLQA